jgi:hypothetical protein
MLVRSAEHTNTSATVQYRDFWGQDKRGQLAASTVDPDAENSYEPLSPEPANWFRLLRWSPRPGYATWPAIDELCAEDPILGLNENRRFALIDSDRDALASRMRAYLDPGVQMADVDPRLSRTYAGFDPARVRTRMFDEHPFDAQQIQRFQFRPLDMRYAYVDTQPGLWNRSRPLLVAAAAAASGFLLVRRRAPRALDGAALHFSDCLVDQKVLFTDAYAIPLWRSGERGTPDNGDPALFDLKVEQQADTWRPNLSGKAQAYLHRRRQRLGAV